MASGLLRCPGLPGFRRCPGMPGLLRGPSLLRGRDQGMHRGVQVPQLLPFQAEPREHGSRHGQGLLPQRLTVEESLTAARQALSDADHGLRELETERHRVEQELSERRSALEQARLVPIAGRLDGTLRLSGPAETPSLEGKVGLDVREPGGRNLGRIESELSWTRTGLRVDAAAGPPAGGRLTVAGMLPWRLTLVPEDTAARVGFARAPADTMALAVRADSFDLGLFEPLLPEETAADLTGALAVDARIAGTPDQPSVNGTVNVRDLGVELPVLGVTYREGRLAGRLDGERHAGRNLQIASDVVAFISRPCLIGLDRAFLLD